MHGRYHYCLFDLDGTLTDSQEGILNCTVYALKRLQLPVPDEATLKKFIGPPLTDSFERYCGCTHEQAVQALKLYRERFAPVGLFENRLYPGIPEMLQSLKLQGKSIILASSKPEEYALRILEFFKIRSYFDLVVGATMDEKLVAKADIIEEVFCRLEAGQAAKKQSVMVGDRKQDILGARSRGVRVIGVRYGYAEPGELEACGPDAYAADVRGLTALLES